MTEGWDANGSPIACWCWDVECLEHDARRCDRCLNASHTSHRPDCPSASSPVDIAEDRERLIVAFHALEAERDALRAENAALKEELNAPKASAMFWMLRSEQARVKELEASNDHLRKTLTANELVTARYIGAVRNYERGIKRLRKRIAGLKVRAEKAELWEKDMAAAILRAAEWMHDGLDEYWASSNLEAIEWAESVIPVRPGSVLLCEQVRAALRARKERR